MPKVRVTCEMLKQGQPHPYADSEYVGILTIERQGTAGFKDPTALFDSS
jgi:hypothetical protein